VLFFKKHSFEDNNTTANSERRSNMPFSTIHPYLSFSRHSKYYLFGLVSLILAAIIVHHCFREKLNAYIIARTEEAFGSQQLAPQQEDFIRAIAQKMEIPVPLMRKMNTNALQTFGYHNAFAAFPPFFVNQPFLFISEGFFEDLSAEEQEFLIGHEMIHLKEEHTRWLVLVMWLLLALLCLVVYVARKKLQPIIQNTFAARYQKIMINIISALLFGACFVITGLVRLAYTRHIEWVADRESLKILKSHRGGIKLLERWEKEFKLPPHNPYWGLLSDHPSCNERKICCMALQNHVKDLSL
jgi:Zn-dependent protease with chaperone function